MLKTVGSDAHKFKILLALLCVAGTTPVVVGQEGGQDRIDIIRGFNESTRCIRTDQQPSEWCVAFQSLLDRHKHYSLAFLLGLNFGFSFTSESTAEDGAADQRELERLAGCALTARVAYEKVKNRLGATDADIVRI